MLRLSPPLKIGTVRLVFKASGKIPFSRLRLKICASGTDMAVEIFFLKFHADTVNVSAWLAYKGLDNLMDMHRPSAPQIKFGYIILCGLICVRKTIYRWYRVKDFHSNISKK